MKVMITGSNIALLSAGLKQNVENIGKQDVRSANSSVNCCYRCPLGPKVNPACQIPDLWPHLQQERRDTQRESGE